MVSPAWDAQRLEAIVLVERVGHPDRGIACPVDGLVGEFDGFDLDARRGCWQSPVESERGRPGHGIGRRRGPRDPQPVRHAVDHMGQQRGKIARHRRFGRIGGRMVGGLFVDHREPHVDAGAVRGKHAAVNRERQRDPRVLLDPVEGLAPAWMVGMKVCAGDRDQPAAGSKPGQRRADMAHRRIGRAPIDMRHRRERRVHQDHARDHVRSEQVVDVRGVMSRDRHAFEDILEQRRARGGKLVEMKVRPGCTGERGKHPRPRRGLEHNVVGRHACSEARCMGERQRRRELLESHTLLRAAGVDREKPGELCEPVGHGVFVGFGREECRRVFAQEEDLRGLAGLVGGLPVPGTVGVGSAEGSFHGGAQVARLDALAALDEREDAGRRRDDRGSDGRAGGGNEGARGRAGAGEHGAWPFGSGVNERARLHSETRRSPSRVSPLTLSSAGRRVRTDCRRQDARTVS